MIPVLLRDMAPRLLLVAALGLLLYLLDPGLHDHAAAEGAAELLAPPQLSFTAANLAGLATLALLGGFVSGDRRRGWHRLFFAHPTRPVSLYGLKWGLGVGLAVLCAGVWLVAAQLAAWGEMRIGLEYLLHAAGMAAVYGALLALFSVLLPRGDWLAALAVFVLTEQWIFWTVEVGVGPGSPALRQAVLLLLPPHLALTRVQQGLALGAPYLAPALLVLGYAAVLLAAAAAILRTREWP